MDGYDFFLSGIQTEYDNFVLTKNTNNYGNGIK